MKNKLHQYFLDNKNDVSKFYYKNKNALSKRFSINCISWLGHSVYNYIGKIEKIDEENALTKIIPTRYDEKNAWYGNFVVCHFNFCCQTIDDKIYAQYKNLVL